MRSQERSQELGNLCHLSKNLWNKLFQQREDSMVWVSEGGWIGGRKRETQTYLEGLDWRRTEESHFKNQKYLFLL